MDLVRRGPTSIWLSKQTVFAAAKPNSSPAAQMTKKHKEPAGEAAEGNPVATIRSLFSTDNPFRQKPAPENLPSPPAAATHVGKRVDAEDDTAKLSKKEEGAPRRKQKRDEVVSGYERRKLGAPGKQPAPPPLAVGVKRKVPYDVAVAEAPPEEEAFDDESKLLRTVFVGNLPLKTKKKALTKEFTAFGEVESIRIRSVPLGDTKIPRKGAVMKGKINESVDNVHAYVVFREEQFARAALSLNMALFNGNHIRVDMACPPRKKLRGEGPLYDRKRTVFVGNLPFDVKDEELYQLFCGSNGSQGDVEAVRVIRDPDSSLGKGIAYVLFKTREAANTIVRKRNLKIRDRFLRLTHAKSADTTPKKMDAGKTQGGLKQKKAFTPGSKSREDSDNKRKVSSLSYQGVKSSKSGVVKKAKTVQRPSNQAKQQGKKPSETGETSSSRVTKRPAVAARKAKQLGKKHKLGASAPENSHRNKKARK